MRSDGSLPTEAASPVRLLDSPMENFARRKDHEGRPFLERDLIKAGLRLHEEFRLTGCEEQIETYLDDLLCQRRDYDLPETSAEQRALEQFRVTLEDLGPGLAEVAVRCCCLSRAWKNGTNYGVVGALGQNRAAHRAATTETIL